MLRERPVLPPGLSRSPLRADQRLLIALQPLGVLALGFCLTWPAHGVIIDSDDGTGNASAPADDPGWAHLGIRGGTTAVYSATAGCAF